MKQVKCSTLSIQTDYSSSFNLYILFKLVVTFLKMHLPRPENLQAFFSFLTLLAPLYSTTLPRKTIAGVWVMLVGTNGSSLEQVFELPLKHLNFSFSLRSWLKKNVLKQSLCVCCLLKTKSSSSQSFTKMLTSSYVQCPFQAILKLFKKLSWLITSD